jgi:hypothetical protein
MAGQPKSKGASHGLLFHFIETPVLSFVRISYQPKLNGGCGNNRSGQHWLHPLSMFQTKYLAAEDRHK